MLWIVPRWRRYRMFGRTRPVCGVRGDARAGDERSGSDLRVMPAREGGAGCAP